MWQGFVPFGSLSESIPVVTHALNMRSDTTDGLCGMSSQSRSSSWLGACKRCFVRVPQQIQEVFCNTVGGVSGDAFDLPKVVTQDHLHPQLFDCVNIGNDLAGPFLRVFGP